MNVAEVFDKDYFKFSSFFIIIIALKTVATTCRQPIFRLQLQTVEIISMFLERMHFVVARLLLLTNFFHLLSF
jgi:hypothetical protein